MVPYLLATWVMALATPECSGADQEAALVLGDEAFGDARAGGRVGFGIGGDPLDLAPITPPLALNSSIARRMPRRSSWPLLPYWPLASQVRPSLIGLAPCAQTRLCCHGPKNVAVPPAAAAIRLPLTMVRREMACRICAASSWFLLLKSACRPFDVSPLLGHRINILSDVVK